MTFNVGAIPFAVVGLTFAAVSWLTRKRFEAAKERRRRIPGASKMHGSPRVFAVGCVLLSVAALVVPFD